jgi:hypothetical protein
VSSIFDQPRPTGPPRHLGPPVGSGVDLLPFAPRPSFPGARRRAIDRLRQDREEPFDGDRLLRDLRSIREASRDPLVMARRLADGADDQEELRSLGWTDETIRRAAAEVVGREPASSSPPGPAAASITAAGGPSIGWCRWHKWVTEGGLSGSSPCDKKILDDYDHYVTTWGEPCPSCRDALETCVRAQQAVAVEWNVTAGGGEPVTSSSSSPAVAPPRELTWGEAQVLRFGVVYPPSTSVMGKNVDRRAGGRSRAGTGAPAPGSTRSSPTSSGSPLSLTKPGSTETHT